MARFLLVLVGASAIGAGSPVAGAQADQVTVPTALEAWYTITPVGGLGLPPLTPYPEGTLHVGITAGSEDARTYLTLDLSRLPDGATLTGGELRLPIDLEPADGTRSLDAAGIDACFAPDPGGEVAGESAPPPVLDCSLREPAVLVDGAFVVDLGRFVRVLDDGGIALVPDDEARAALASWHVTLHGRGSAAPGAEPISANLLLASSPATAPVPQVTVPLSTAPPGGGEFAGPVVFAAPVPAVVLPPPASVGAPVVPRLATPVAALPVDERFAYGIVFALPLALLAFGGYFANALTKPAIVDRARLVSAVS